MKAAVVVPVVAIGVACVLVAPIALTAFEDPPPPALDAAAGPGIGGGLAEGSVPKPFVKWITKAATTCPAVTAPLIAAQLNQESQFKTHATSPVGAAGPAQFMPSTAETWVKDDDGNGQANPRDIGDAVMGLARFDCALVGEVDRYKNAGKAAGSTVKLALAAYNAGPGRITQYGGIPPFAETKNYVSAITGSMAKFSDGTGGVNSGGTDVPAGDYKAIIKAATSQVGLPYAWGGGSTSGPTRGFGMGAGSVGFDCSSLMMYAFYKGTGGKVLLPRTATPQMHKYATHRVSLDALKPGDMIFSSGSVSFAGHVKMYIGNNKVVQAPSQGRDLEIAPLYTQGAIMAVRVPLTDKSR